MPTTRARVVSTVEEMATRTVVPLTREAGAVQAWKIVIPASQSRPTPRVHDGYEWLYVLSGRVRLVLGDDDLVLAPGEAAEF